MSGKRPGEDSQLRMVERRRNGQGKSGLGERANYFEAVSEICDFSSEFEVSRDVPDLEEFGQGLRHGNECAGCRST